MNNSKQKIKKAKTFLLENDMIKETFITFDGLKHLYDNNLLDKKHLRSDFRDGDIMNMGHFTREGMQYLIKNFGINSNLNLYTGEFILTGIIL